MDGFSFSTAGRIIFGQGAIERLATETSQLGHRPLLVTGSRPEPFAKIEAQLLSAGLQCSGFQIAREPDVDIIAQGAELAREKRCDVVIGLGGGSVMDGAKAIAALTANPGSIYDYLEVIGKAMPLEYAPVPCIAIPTTAGTGSEVTRNAVIRSPQHGIKVSMRSPAMLPDLAVVDPAMTLSMSPEITAATGFDALAQLLEAFVSVKANPLTDGLCREGLGRCARSLKTACLQNDDLAARTDMAIASLFSGIALANAGLGAVHGIAGPLGGMIAAPHGAVCARLLPEVTAANIAALEDDPDENPLLERYAEAARLLTGDLGAVPGDCIDWLSSTVLELQIPGLSRWGLAEDHVTELAGHALRASSMRGNPVTLKTKTLEAVIRQAMETGG